MTPGPDVTDEMGSLTSLTGNEYSLSRFLPIIDGRERGHVSPNVTSSVNCRHALSAVCEDCPDVVPLS